MEKKSVVEKFKIHYNRGTKKQKTREVLFMEAKDRVYQALCRMAKSDCQITAAALAEELNLSRQVVSHYLNRLLEEGCVEKTLTRPVCWNIRKQQRENVQGSVSEERKEIENETVNEEIFKAVKNHTLVNRRKIDKETCLDNLLINLCFTFDINYPKTFSIIEQDQDIDKTLEKFKFNNKETKEKIEEIHKEINNYIKENKG